MQASSEECASCIRKQHSCMSNELDMTSATMEACLTGQPPGLESVFGEHQHAQASEATDPTTTAAHSASQVPSARCASADTTEPEGLSVNDNCGAQQLDVDSPPLRTSEGTNLPHNPVLTTSETASSGLGVSNTGNTAVDLESASIPLQQAHTHQHLEVVGEPELQRTAAADICRASEDGSSSADHTAGEASSITLAAGLTVQSTDALEPEATAAATSLLLDSLQPSALSEPELAAGPNLSDISAAEDSEAMLGSRPASGQAGISVQPGPSLAPQAAPAMPRARAAQDGLLTRHPPSTRAPACTSPRPTAVLPTVVPQGPSSSDSRPSTALLVRPALINRAASPAQRPSNGRCSSLLFSPSDSPPLTPPDSPSTRHPQPEAGRDKSSGGPGRPGPRQRSPSRGPPVGRQSLRALPPSAYKRRRTPVDELLANFNLTKYVGQMARDKHGRHSRQPPAPPDPQLRDLELAAERLQREGNALQPRSTLQERQGQASGEGTQRPGSGRAGNAGPGVLQGGLGPEEDSGVGLGQVWVDGELLGSPPEWASDLSSRPESARRTGRLLHQDSGDGRHQGMTGLSPYQGLATHMQGAYLTYPEYSFGGCRPFKASPERGVPFERYGHKDEPASAVQQFYLRPDRSVLIGMQQMVEKQQQQQQLLQQQQQMALGGPNPGGPRSEQRQGSPPRLLPNGVPVSRLEQLREVHEQGRQKTLPASRKGRRQSSNGGPKEPVLTPNQSLRAESSTVLTVQDASVFDGSGRRPFSRMLSTKASMPRQLSTLPAELEAAAATAVEMGLTALLIAPDTAEPVLDPYFFASMKAHFNQLAEDQTLRLQSKLNTGLPTILKQFGVKHVNSTVSGGTGRRSGLLPVD